MKYIDYTNTWRSDDNIFHAYLHKRKSFEHEHELRAITIGPDEESILQSGMYIPCDLNILIEKIFVSPGSPSWFKELVIAVIDKYNLNKEVTRSNLDDDPLF